MNIYDQLKFSNEYWVIFLPCIFMALDIISGVLKAMYTESFESKAMRKGLIHKACEIIIIAIFEMMKIGMNLPAYIVGFASLYIIFMEVYSVSENLDACGIKIPTFIKKSLKQTADKIDKGDFSGTESEDKDDE